MLSMLQGKKLYEYLRQKYPSPVSAEFNRADGYCVGGTLCLFIEGVESRWTRFPSPSRLAMALEAANPRLHPNEADAYAEEITHQNDSGNFGRAWQLLYDALVHSTED